MHSMFSAQSDTVITALCLGAIDFHLSRRFRIAFVLLVLGSLGRPEVWPFVGLYGLWLWWKHPSSRWLVYGGFLVIPAMWFGIPTITNHRPFVSAQLALLSPREVTGNKFTGVANRYATLHYLPLQLAALLGFVMAWFRRDRVVLALGAAVILWVVVEIAFALHGWPAVPRYMYEAEGVTVVIAAVAVGWLLKDGLAFVGRYRPRWARPIGIALVAILAVALVPPAIARLREEHRDLIHERARTKEINLLAGAVNAYGGYKHLLACGHPVTAVGLRQHPRLVLAPERRQGRPPAPLRAAPEVSDRAVHPAPQRLGDDPVPHARFSAELPARAVRLHAAPLERDLLPALSWTLSAPRSRSRCPGRSSTSGW